MLFVEMYEITLFLLKDNRAIFQKPHKLFLNCIQISLKFVIIYGQLIDELEQQMNILVLEIEGVKHSLVMIKKLIKSTFCYCNSLWYTYLVSFIMFDNCFFI